jgi:ABC-type lipoprotein export system ATPase subunit
VAVVRALINKPSIILADEPTGALDSKNAEILGELLLEINKDFGITVILATHSPGLASKMSKKLRLEAGILII